MDTANIASLLATGLTLDETPETHELILKLRIVQPRGYLTRREFLAICRWKSPRAIRLYEKNSPARIRRQSAIALASRSESLRFDALTELHGVGAPIASAILTLTNPRRYGVLDIRVWQLLHAHGSVTTKPGGVGFNCGDWLEYLRILRGHAKALSVSVRAVEYSLFLHHQRSSRGLLYGGRDRPRYPA